MRTSKRWDQESFQALIRDRNLKVQDQSESGVRVCSTVRQPKYGNRRIEVDNEIFHSRLEADRYCELKVLHSAGKVLYFLRQVPFRVAPGVRWYCDFFVVYRSSQPGLVTIEVEDTKGFFTDKSKVKIKVIEDRYPIKVRVLTRKEISKCSPRS